MILERDKIPEVELGEVIKYGLNENFYRTIIFSPTNLREQYPKILTHMRAQQQTNRNSSTPSGKPKLEITTNAGAKSVSAEELERSMQRAKEMKAAREREQKEAKHR